MRQSFATVVAVIQLGLIAAAQDLAFITPNITALSVNAKGWHYYMQGRDVEITWTSPFDQTTLLVFEARDNGTWTFDVLAVDYTPSQTSFTWQAQPIDSAGLGNKMYFAIENSNNISCNNCVVKTPGFYVTNVRPAGGSYSSSMSTAASTSAATASAGQTSPSPTAAGAASQTAANSQGSQTPQAAGDQGHNPTSHHSSNGNAVGLGVGLGVGLAVLFALIALLLLCLRRRRKQKRDSFNYRPTGSGNWTQDDTPPNDEVIDAPEPKSMIDLHRESGVLGGTAVAGLASQSRHSNVSHASNPFVARPSTSASRLSHASWIEPFEFEKPGSREADAMSQLRHSVNADSAIATESTARAGADNDNASSNYSNDGPETFGPESPSDAAAVASPSSYVGGYSRQSGDMTNDGSVGMSPSSPGIPRKPVSARVSDGRHWPLT